MRWRRLHSFLLVMGFVSCSFSRPHPARAEGNVVPLATELPSPLTLDEALRIFHARGLDLLIAEAAVRTAEGAVQMAGAPPGGNPVLSASLGNAFTYVPNQTSCNQSGAVCSPLVWNVGISDSAVIEDTVSGKRDLRLKVARNALAAAKMSRVDAERTIAFQVKSAYVLVAQDVLGFRFAKEVRDSNVKTLLLFRTRFRSRAINDGDLARIEAQKLESDQALASAVQALRQGTNAALQTPMVTIGIAAPLPFVYQLQGELRQAEALYDTSSLEQAKATSQVVSEVAAGFAGYAAARELVERMEGARRDDGGLLESARVARDITGLQYEKGAASLTDYLDALRAYIATNVEYFTDLSNYWTAVFQLEEAVGMELRR